MEDPSLVLQLLCFNCNLFGIVSGRTKDSIGLFLCFIEKVLGIVFSLLQDVMSLILLCMLDLVRCILGQNNRLAQGFFHLVKDRQTVLEGLNLCFLSMIFMNQIFVITSDDVQEIIYFFCIVTPKFGTKGFIF